MAVKKRGFLRQMAEQAKRTASTLKETLVAAQGGHFVSTFQRGRLVVSQSGAGQSGSFEMGVTGKEWTQDNVFALIEELIELCDFTIASQALTDDGTPANTDTLMQAMFADDMLQGIRSSLGDFTSLRITSTR